MSMTLSDGTHTVEIEWWKGVLDAKDIIFDWYRMALDGETEDIIYEDPDRPGVYMVSDIEYEVEKILNGAPWDDWSWYDEDTDVLRVDGWKIRDVSDLPWNWHEDEED